jgi:hypothetical protein
LPPPTGLKTEGDLVIPSLSCNTFQSTQILFSQSSIYGGEFLIPIEINQFMGVLWHMLGLSHQILATCEGNELLRIWRNPNNHSKPLEYASNILEVRA